MKTAWIVGIGILVAGIVPVALKLARDPETRQRLGMFNTSFTVDPEGDGAGIDWEVDSQRVTTLHREGRFEEALTLANKALEKARAKVGDQHPDTATSLHNIGSACYSLARYAEAEEALLKALAIREKTLKPNSRDIAASLENLAVLYRKTDRADKAAPLDDRAAKIRRNQPFSLGN